MATLTTTGGNLFAIAAATYGDATQWIAIARLNGLRDPQLAGLATLLLPDAQTAAASAGGIVQQ